MRTFTTQHTVYTFDELSDTAKAKAINDQRQFEWDYNMGMWLSDSMSEKLQELLKENKMKCDNAKVYYSFSYSQGDGAMFEGDISYKGYTYTVKHTGHYSHYKSYTLTDIERNNGNNISSETYERLADEFGELYETICKQLEKYGYAEIEYATSDETLAENIRANEYEFYENGEKL